MRTRAAVALLAGLFLGAQPPEPSSPRMRFTLNDGWRFAAGGQAGAEAATFADSAWERVSLPHTWNVEDALDERATYRRGEGWYRRALDLPGSLAGRRIFLFFEGANQVAEVFVNGTSVGTHVGGYTAFAFDVTDHVRPGAANTLAVRVDNAHDPAVPPLNADFTFFGGIYRDVWLIATDPLHIDLLDHASPGIFIDTPEVSAERAIVRVRGTIVNDGHEARRARVRHRVRDPDGREVAAFESNVDVPAAGRVTFEVRSPVIERPSLWSPASPALYRVVTEVVHDGRVTDRLDSPLGFRWFRVDAQEGFFLNGRPHPLYGTNRHQDRAGVGNALTDAQHREDVRHVKETGFDFLRLAHYPQDPAVLEATDELGLAVWEEIPVVNIITQSEAFAENAERMLVEMIRQHYNHPSVLMWGYMNEVLLVRPRPEPDGYVADVVALAERLEAVARREDSTRATVTAVSFDEIDNGSGQQDVSRILGLNLYFGWYYRELEGFGAYLDSLHARHPDRPLLISEYGAGSDERVHTREPRAFDFSAEHQQRFHERSFAQIRVRPWLVGSAVWNHFDFGSAGRQDTKPGINQKGLLFHDRAPKDILYYYRAALRDDAVLHIATREWPHRAGSRAGDAAHPVVVYTNLPEAELLVNGTSFGVRQPENHVAEWTVELRQGTNRLEARAGNVRDVVDVMYTDRVPFFRDAASVVREIAVNAGGAYEVIGPGDLVWEADRGYVPGSWGHVGGRPARTHHRMPGTDLEPLVQASRTGATEYRFDVPDGDYEIRLLFVETEHDDAGRRIMDVVVNGDAVFDDLDLAARYGRWETVERGTRVVARDGAGVRVQLTARIGETTISGLHLRRH